MAVINDFSNDIKTLQEKEGLTQSDIAKKLGMQQNGISQAIHGKVIPQRFADIVEALGYDIKVVYVRNDQVIKK